MKMPIRAKVYIVVEASADSKTMMVNIETIQIVGCEEVYIVFPPYCQSTNYLT